MDAFKCDICQEIISTKSNLSRHQLVIHGRQTEAAKSSKKRRYKCEFCKKEEISHIWKHKKACKSNPDNSKRPKLLCGAPCTPSSNGASPVLSSRRRKVHLQVKPTVAKKLRFDRLADSSSSESEAEEENSTRVAGAARAAHAAMTEDEERVLSNMAALT